MSLQVQRLEVLDPGRGPLLVRVTGRWEGGDPKSHALIVESADGAKHPVRPLPAGADSSPWKAGYAVDRAIFAGAARLAIWHPGGLAALPLPGAAPAPPAPAPTPLAAEPAPAVLAGPTKLETQLKQAIAGAAKSLEAARERARVAEARAAELSALERELATAREQLQRARGSAGGKSVEDLSGENEEAWGYTAVLAEQVENLEANLESAELRVEATQAALDAAEARSADARARLMAAERSQRVEGSTGQSEEEIIRLERHVAELLLRMVAAQPPVPGVAGR